MRTHKRARVVVIFCLVFVVGIVVGILVSWFFGVTRSTEAGGVGDGVLAHPTAAFTISGDISGLVVPGSHIPLNVGITNGSTSPMTVTHLRVTVKAVTASHASALFPCSVGDFTVTQVSGDFEVQVAAKSTATLDSLGLPSEEWPTAGMLDATTNQDGCKGASLTLEYSAEGRLNQ
jgi:hypothetical protein